MDPVVVAVTPVPWLKFPPDRKVYVGGLAGVLTWLILSVAQHLLGFDPQAFLNSVIGPGAPDVQLIVTGAITLLVAHFTTPSIQDVVAHVNNAVVKLANADPANPTTAVVVTEAAADVAAKVDAIAGALPEATVKKMVIAGVIAPNVVGGKTT